jgi:hypothetical protein
MIKLETIELPDNMVWKNHNSNLGLTAVTSRSLNGTLVIYEAELGNQNIDLVAEENSGWLTHAQVLALRNLAKSAGATYTLEYEGDIITVRFRHEDSPVLDITPLITRPNPQDSDYYYGTIKLMEV